MTTTDDTDAQDAAQTPPESEAPQRRRDYWPTIVLVAGPIVVLLVLGGVCLLGLPWFAGRVPGPLLGTALAGQRTATAQVFAGPTETAAAQAAATAAVQLQWPVILSDSFDTNTHNWTTGDINRPTERVSQTIADGKYRWELHSDQPGGAVWYGLAEADPVSDFYLTVEARQVAGSETSIFGVIFRRVNASNYYYFSISESEQCAFALLYENEWVTIQTWQAPGAIRPAKPNQIAVSAQGRHFVFFVNGQAVGQVTDGRLARGKVGFAAGVSAGSNPLILQYDDFELRIPPVAPTAVPRATATTVPRATATDVPQATATDVLQATAASELAAEAAAWPIVFSDTFQSADQGWEIGTANDEYARIGWKISSERYVWSVTAHRDMYWHQIPRIAPFSDFMLTVDVEQTLGPDDAGFGVVFRREWEDDLYYFGVTEEGDGYVWLLERDEWTTLASWRRLTSIRPGEVNQITVIAQQQHFIFLLNGVYVGEVNDATFDSGKVGLAVDLVAADDRAVIAFDNFTVRAPPATATPTWGPAASATPTRTPTP